MAKVGRIDWVDYAKGVTIMLVVFHHAIGANPNYQNELAQALQTFNAHLTYFRMPFFIFIAGLFIQKALESDLGVFLEKKVFHFLYLFTLWSLLKTVFVPLTVNLAQGDTAVAAELINPLNFATIFVSPPETLWFIYALLIFFSVMRLCRDVPPFVILVGAAVVYVLSTSAHGAVPPFYQRTGHLFPFFALGYFGSLQVRTFAERVKPHFLIVAPPYAVLAWWLLAANIGADALIFATEILGVTTGIVIAKLTATLAERAFATRAFEPIKYVGSHSLAVYLGHFFPILVIELLAEWGLISAELLVLTLKFTLGVFLPILLFKLSQRFGWGWLYGVPEWLRVLHRRVPVERRAKG